jgi:hypothetical protein
MSPRRNPRFAGIKRCRRVGVAASPTPEDAAKPARGVLRRRCPKTPSVRDPTGFSSQPESCAGFAATRRLRRRTSRRSPRRGRSPVEWSPGPKPLRCEHLRPFLERPKPPLDRTSGRDGPESFLTFRGLIPAAIRHTRADCLGRRVARSSPGLDALQGVPPLCGRLGSHRAFPSWVLFRRAQATGEPTLQGVARSEVGSSLSRLPTLMGFVAS